MNGHRTVTAYTNRIYTCTFYSPSDFASVRRLDIMKRAREGSVPYIPFWPGATVIQWYIASLWKFSDQITVKRLAFTSGAYSLRVSQVMRLNRFCVNMNTKYKNKPGLDGRPSSSLLCAQGWLRGFLRAVLCCLGLPAAFSFSVGRPFGTSRPYQVACGLVTTNLDPPNLVPPGTNISKYMDP